MPRGQLSLRWLHRWPLFSQSFSLSVNLDANFIQSFPEDAPNLFFLDIQTDQLDAFAELLGIETTYFPVVRGGIVEINGEPIDRAAEEDRDGDNLSRQFNFTYRNELIEGEGLVEGDAIFRTDWEGAQVSLLDDLRQIRDFQIGDTITFRIQGVPFDARIASIRSRSEEDVQPFFNFVFQEAVLKDLPQTIFTAVRIENQKIAPLQNRMVAAFPNVSIIDVTSAIAAFSELAGKITRVIRFFTLFSIIAGVLIIIKLYICNPLRPYTRSRLF